MTEVPYMPPQQTRAQTSPTMFTDTSSLPKKPDPPKDLVTLLKFSCSNNREKGWRAKDCGLSNKRSSEFRSQLFFDRHPWLLKQVMRHNGSNLTRTSLPTHTSFQP